MAETMKISGEISSLLKEENRAIIFDCGRGLFISDFILKDCGGYTIGDRVTITIEPCGKEEYHYPPKPKEMSTPSFLK